MSAELYTKRFERPTDPRLRRNVVHDPQSRDHPVRQAVNQNAWRDRTLRIVDPIPNPNQPVGNCTTCAKCMQLNAAGNRVPGVVFKMPTALDWYEWETAHDPFPGAWKRDGSGQDTGSNGLSSCKAAQHFGVGGTYRWFFGGIDQIVSYLMEPDAIPVSVGTWWYEDEFYPNSAGVITPTGAKAGGHQYILRGYNLRFDRVKLRCWWGPEYRDVEMDRAQMGDKLADDGDAHVQERTAA